MNFYTFSSKIKSPALFMGTVLIVFLFLNIILDAFLVLYVDKKTNKNSYIREKISKAKHMSLQDGINLKDIIFLGTSRTSFHISNNAFKKNGFEIYNFGVSGRYLVDYPFMSSEAIKYNPKVVVISISVNDLFNDNIGNFSGEITLIDLQYILETQNFDIKLKAISRFVKQQHSLFTYGSPIFIRLSQKYRDLNDFVVLERESSKDLRTVELDKKTLKKIENIQEINFNDFAKKSDCNIFDINAPDNNPIRLKCTNGDAIMFGNYVTKLNKPIQKLTQVSQSYLSLFNRVLKNISDAGIYSIVVLEPILNNSYQYDITQIQDVLMTNKIIDNTNANLDKSLWADDTHLNNDGRVEYSNMLAQQLKHYFSDLKE